MSDIEILIALVAVAAVLVRFADMVSIPYPIVLVLGGLAIGALPGGPSFQLDPEAVFLVFLPPLLQAAGYWSSPRELRAELGALSWLVLALPLVTMVAVGAAAQALIGGLNWASALLLGAIVAPTDPVAAVATFSRIGVPDRISLLVEGESMFNDATALVAYRVALSAVVAGTFSAGSAAIDLVVGVLGGFAIGLAVAWLTVQALRRLDDPPLSILLSVLMGYFTLAICEQIGASGVLAVVSGGVYLGWRSHEIFDADVRLSATAFWEVLVFTLNAVIFILLGLQFPDIVNAVSKQLSAGELIGYGALVAGVVIVVRIAWQFLPATLDRIWPAVGTVDTGSDWRERIVVGWSGMRGAVSLAAALALPLELDSGADFASRELIIYLTVAVILATLVLQGLSLPSLIKGLGLESERPFAPDEAVARLATAQAALDRLDELEASEDDGISEVAVERLRELYRARFARCIASLEGGQGTTVPIENPITGYRRIRRDLIAEERQTLLELRDGRGVRGDVLRRIERDLDLDEARLIS